MLAQIILIMNILMNNGELTLYDFESNETMGKWYIINDEVMGGISTSRYILNENGTATFSGVLSLENNGGFASVRSIMNKKVSNDYRGIIVRLKGDGNIYSIRFRTNQNFDGYAYQTKIQSIQNTWKEFKIPFENFKPTYRGMTLTGLPELESADIEQFGLLIADKQYGEFTVDIDWIKFYK